MSDKEKVISLLEWYQGVDSEGQNTAVSTANDTIDKFVNGPFSASVSDEGEVKKQAVDVENEKKEEPKPQEQQEKKEQLDKWLEMYKAFALLKILENKFVMLSGELNASNEDKEKAKSDIKLMIDKMRRVINAL